MGRLPVEGGLSPVCPIMAGADLSVALAPGETIQRECVLTQERLSAPVAAGGQVGELVCSLNGRELARVPLVTGQGMAEDRAEPAGLLDKLLSHIARLTGLI